MNIQESLFAEHSKKNTLRLSEYIGSDKRRFSELMACLFQNDEVLSQRAAWVMTYCLHRHPELLKPYLKQSISILGKPVHDAVKRNIIRALEHQEIPVSLQGRLVSQLFIFLQDNAVPVSIKAFSMGVLAKICKTHPVLKNELLVVIKVQFPFETAGFKSKAKKIIKQLEMA